MVDMSRFRDIRPWRNKKSNKTQLTRKMTISRRLKSEWSHHLMKLVLVTENAERRTDREITIGVLIKIDTLMFNIHINCLPWNIFKLNSTIKNLKKCFKSLTRFHFASNVLTRTFDKFCRIHVHIHVLQ